jgi:hypothetical protein
MKMSCVYWKWCESKETERWKLTWQKCDQEVEHELTDREA